MSDRFITPAALPTPYESEVLTILVEEHAESIQRATKLMRFGADDIEQGQPLNNRHRLSTELGQTLHMIDLCIKLNLADTAEIEAARADKPARLAKYMQQLPPDTIEHNNG